MLPLFPPNMCSGVSGNKLKSFFEENVFLRSLKMAISIVTKFCTPTKLNNLMEFYILQNPLIVNVIINTFQSFYPNPTDSHYLHTVVRPADVKCFVVLTLNSSCVLIALLKHPNDAVTCALALAVCQQSYELASYHIIVTLTFYLQGRCSLPFL